MSKPITTQELAAELGVVPRTVQRWCRERVVPHMRYGRTIRFMPHQVAEIRQHFERGALARRPEVDVPNPVYRPEGVVVSMRRPA